ncbi:MAG: glycosyltransferase family 2 protein [archaeon]
MILPEPSPKDPSLASFKGKAITIAMPAYNEEKIIASVVKDAVSVLKKMTSNYHVLVVDDGSADKTGAVLDRLAASDKRIKVIHFPRNRGVGAANHAIYKNVKGEILFWNASDNQIRMNEFYRLLPYAAEYDIVVGNRMQRADSFFRRLVSGMFSLLLRIRFRLPVKDIDSVKLFRVSVFKKLKLESKTAFIETELLIKAKKRGLKIKEIPIRHYPRMKGKAKGVRLKIIIPQLTQLFKALFRMKW